MYSRGENLDDLAFGYKATNELHGKLSHKLARFVNSGCIMGRAAQVHG
jgi:hypothetical protein